MIRLLLCSYQNTDFVEYLSDYIDRFEEDMEFAIEDGDDMSGIPLMNVRWDEIEKHYHEVLDVDIEKLHHYDIETAENDTIVNSEILELALRDVIKSLEHPQVLHRLNSIDMENGKRKPSVAEQLRHAGCSISDQQNQVLEVSLEKKKFYFIHLGSTVEFARLKYSQK